VVSALYRLIRNPMYVGVVLFVLGQAVLFRSPVIAAYALVLFMVFHLRVVTYEEPVLVRTFGTAWHEYAGHVPRWIPRLRRS
jgi:protein-S-isoprenylcysteine O-methyltransferase Ste14